MTSKTMITQPPDEGKQSAFAFAASMNKNFTPRNEPDWAALSRKGAIKLVQTLRWEIQNNHHFTKAELDEIFARPHRGVWSWDRTLRKLNAISIEVYGYKRTEDKLKPRRPVYFYKKNSHCDGEYIFLMTPRDIFKMLREHQQKHRIQRVGSHA